MTFCCNIATLGLLYPVHLMAQDENTAGRGKGNSANIDFAREYYKQGMSYAQYGLYDEAVEMYKKSLEMNPDNIEAYKNLGIAYYQKGMHDNAIESFKKVL